MKILRIVSLALLVVVLLTSCEKLLEQKPESTGANLLPSEAVRTTAELREVLNSAYDVIANTYNGNIQNLANLMSDNLERPFQQDDYTSVWLRATTIFNGTVSQRFTDLYIATLRANTVMDNFGNVEDLSEADRVSFEAEARFIRALCHFEAVRLWAHAYDYTPANSHPGVAIRTSSEIENAARPSVEAVYNQILNDLAFAEENLPTGNNDVYANVWAAKALEAEVRFQRHEYELAYNLANEVISSSPYTLDTLVNRYTYPNVSSEAIFYVFSAIQDNGNVDFRGGAFRGNYFPPTNPTLRITQDLYDRMIQFGSSTPRGSLYQEIDQDGNIAYVTNMFDSVFFHVPVLSITQMLLIRAESAAEIGGNLSQAIDDINAIRTRAYGGVVGNLPAGASAQDIIQAARLERRLEFPFNGQRFHDIKRIGSQGENIIVRGAPWDCNGMILQFPSTERTDLFPLNPGGGC